MVPPSTRRTLLAGLVVCFGVQTWLVYSDEPSGVRLEGEELAGAHAWQRHNCQSCHQLYGFGGFLGPDLTNAADRLGPDGLRQRLEQVMTEGAGQMPAFDTSPDERAALVAFLQAMDRTGQGQARVPNAAMGFAEAAREVHRETDGEAGQVGAGLEALGERPCLSCHHPFDEAGMGAPPLTAVADWLEPEVLAQVLAEGKAPRMPPPSPPFSEQELGDVQAALVWLAGHDEEIRAVMAGSTGELAWSELPWWEYR